MTKTIYCDFDGTVTKKDAVNTFFEQFALPSWVESEKLWREGKITSRENALIQVGLVREITEKELGDFINSVEIDDYFPEFYRYLKENGIKLVILSDGFDLFIEKTLERLNIKDVEFFANHVFLENNKLKIEFPHFNPSCDIGAGMCKCSKVREKDFIYIGDGVSDLCAAKKAKKLFASKSLLKYCEQKEIPCIPFENFRDIIEFIKAE
ncbi:MtnX-like HAD-IB family phosphatase [bacterium]|nr:MtnX-like HAD-IB family phosphatase [bacterium]